jgi:acyl carrier protein phosphodiesterase
MNHLAHLFLAADTPESLLGNLSGDFVKGPLGVRFPAAVRDGIVEHRKIDEFTDTHPVAAAFRRVIVAEQGHYARVIADMFFDHFLASNWRDYSEETLESFLERVFSKLDPLIPMMPEPLQLVYPRMRDGRWLLSYREIGGIRTALSNMSYRFSRRPRLETAVHLLKDERSTLERHFQNFFPQVMAYAKALRSRT